MQHFLAHIPTRTIMRRRFIGCPLCSWSRNKPIRNALGDSAFLRGELAKHLREQHPETMPAGA